MEQNVSKRLNLLTNAHAIRGRPTLKDVKRDFWNGSVHESVAIDSFDNVDSEDITSCHQNLTSSHQITNIGYYNLPDKTVITDAKLDLMNAEIRTLDVPADLRRLDEQRHELATNNNKAAAILTNAHPRRTQEKLSLLVKDLKPFPYVVYGSFW